MEETGRNVKNQQKTKHVLKIKMYILIIESLGLYVCEYAYVYKKLYRKYKAEYLYEVNLKSSTGAPETKSFKIN